MELYKVGEDGTVYDGKSSIHTVYDALSSVNTVYDWGISVQAVYNRKNSVHMVYNRRSIAQVCLSFPGDMNRRESPNYFGC